MKKRLFEVDQYERFVNALDSTSIKFEVIGDVREHSPFCVPFFTERGAGRGGEMGTVILF